MTQLCHRYVKDENDTLEVVSEGFVKVFRNIHHFQYLGEGGLTAWIKKIMLNEALGALRKRKVLHLSISENGSQLLADRWEWDQVEAEYIYDAILSLPDGCRAVFNLYVIEGYKHKEIARELEITESTSRSQLTLAKQKLQSILSEHVKPWK